MSFISISGLDVFLKHNHVLRDLNVEVGYGAVGLLGPNGAGKSTLLRTLLGFVRPTAGDIKLLGLSVVEQGAAIRERVGYMPEHESLIPGLSGVSFVAYLAQLAGLPREDALQRAHESLWQAGLGEARYRSVETYSTGMKQRLKLAQAIAHDPEVLFLDEPTNGLDPDGRQDMLDLIRELAVQKGKNILLSSHILPDVEAVCEHVVVLHHGRIVEAGRLSDLKTLHRTAYDIRIKGDSGGFVRELRDMNFEVDAITENSGASTWRGRVTMTDPKDGAGEIICAARQSNVQIRSIVRRELSLEEIFQAALKRDTPTANHQSGNGSERVR